MNEAVVVNRRVVQIAGSGGSGGLIVRTRSAFNGSTITLYRLDENGNNGQALYASILEYKGENNSEYAAVFPTLLSGNYKAIEPGYTTVGKNVTVFPGNTAQVDFT